jgi:hypothetical protein
MAGERDLSSRPERHAPWMAATTGFGAGLDGVEDPAKARPTACELTLISAPAMKARPAA